MPELIFHPDVAQEIKVSYEWYEDHADGLGDDFIAELESAYKAILELPNTWPKFGNSCRRFLLERFPFSVIYHPGQKTIFVVAVMHNGKKPGYWEYRT
jgi:hypothetical protein